MIKSLVPAAPIPVESERECRWYHTFDRPDGTTIQGAWDYRHNVDDYLGRVDFAGKSVLEIGPASGYLTIAMEKRGAHVTAIETPVDEAWEYVPRVDRDLEQWIRQRKRGNLELKKSWWYTQKLFGGTATVAYCGVSALRELAETLRFDTCLIGGVLQHVRHPLDLLWAASKISSEIIVTERHHPYLEDGRPSALFAPKPDNEFLDTWWYLSSTVVANFLAIRGFELARKYAFQCRLRSPAAWAAGNPEGAKEVQMYSALFRRTAKD